MSWGMPLCIPLHPPLSPNSFAQSSNSCRPCLLTLGLIFIRLASKSPKLIGRISSVDMYRRASPKLRRGPIAASLANAVMSLPEKPTIRYKYWNDAHSLVGLE